MPVLEPALTTLIDGYQHGSPVGTTPPGSLRDGTIRIAAQLLVPKGSTPLVREAPHLPRNSPLPRWYASAHDLSRR